MRVTTTLIGMMTAQISTRYLKKRVLSQNGSSETVTKFLTDVLHAGVGIKQVSLRIRGDSGKRKNPVREPHMFSDSILLMNYPTNLWGCIGLYGTRSV